MTSSRFVVKVQVSIAGEPSVLVYDSGDNIIRQFEWDDQYKELPALSFWWARIENDYLNLEAPATGKEFDLYPYGAIKED